MDGARIMLDGKDIMPGALTAGAALVRIIKGTSKRYYVALWENSDLAGTMVWNCLPGALPDYSSAMARALPYMIAAALAWLDGAPEPFGRLDEIRARIARAPLAPASGIIAALRS
jgi:hypothetical protein